MYLLSWHKDRSVLEASLGGKMDAAEIRAMGEELTDMLDDVEAESFKLLLNQAGAYGYDSRAYTEIDSLKDLCLKYGATQIVSVIEDDRIRTNQMTSRLQLVMEGIESYVERAEVTAFPITRSRKAHQTLLKAA